jgi:hypothetical protein
VDNPDRNWSPWKKIDLGKNDETGIPAARYAQWKAVLHAGTRAPAWTASRLNYLPKNVAPEIDDVTVQVAVKYQPQPKTFGHRPGIRIRRISIGRNTFRSSAAQFARSRFHRCEMERAR